MSRNARTARLAALVVAGTMMAGCAQQVDAGDRVAGDVAEQGYVSGDGSTTIVAQAERAAAPSLAGPTLDGATLALADHLGEVVVLNVWASWCAPCRAEAPALQEVSEELADRGVRFVGLNTRDSAEPARSFVERFGLTYPSIVDADGSKQLLFRDSLPPAAIPSTLVIDRSGRVAGRAIGEVDRSRLLGLVEPILAEPESGAPGGLASPGPTPAGTP